MIDQACFALPVKITNKYWNFKLCSQKLIQFVLLHPHAKIFPLVDEKLDAVSLLFSYTFFCVCVYVYL